MKAILTAALVLVSLPAHADGFKPGMMVGAFGGCKSQDAVLAIAEADAASQAQAETVFQMYSRLGVCGRFPQPVPAEVVAVLMDYSDYEDTPTQVLEVRFQDVTFFMIAVQSIADDAPTREMRL